MATKKKKTKSDIVLVHYRKDDGEYCFTICTRNIVEKKKLELMLLGMKEIHVPLIDWETGGQREVMVDKVKWDDYSMEEVKKMKSKRKKRK